jgi:nucleotide-binding universal stress UspA family protein
VDYGVCEGDAVDELVKYVERWGGDVIVAATEGRTGLGRILVGSVAERLLQKSPVPVLVAGPAVQ